MQRVVMLLSNDGASDPRVEKEAIALVRAGREVVVVAWDRAGAQPPSEECDGYRIERLGPRASHGGGARNLPRYREFWRAAAARVVELAPDVIHCHDLDTAPAGLTALKHLSDRPRLVLDFHELYRYSRMVPQRGFVGFAARRAVRLVERRAIPRADVVLTVSPGQVQYYRDAGAREVVLVENAPDLERYHVVNRDEDDFVACFIGQKRYLPGLVSLIEAVQFDERLGALIVGGGPAEQAVADAARGKARVEVHGRVGYGEIAALYDRCDAVYACYDNALENWRTAFPVKVMEGMACGLPVIVAKGSWVADYVAEHRIGVSADGADPSDVAGALLSLADGRHEAREMGERGRALAEAGLNWAAAAGRLVAVYDSLESRSAG